MMTTPVAIALVFIMMMHPQLGVLNYLLSLVGLPPQLWVYDKNTVIGALVLVETWQWTPLIMLIVLGGLAALPTEPYESALIDGASQWDMFRFITLPLVMPFLMVAIILRAIDAIKSFDIIFVMTQGGPGTASETINIYLYLQAFSFFNIGHASAVVIVFFVIIVALAVVLLWTQGADAMDTMTDRWVAHPRLRKLASRLALAFALFVVVSPAHLCHAVDGLARLQERD